MPIYEFECKACKTTLEVTMQVDKRNQSIKCKACKKSMKRVVSRHNVGLGMQRSAKGPDSAKSEGNATYRNVTFSNNKIEIADLLGSEMGKRKKLYGLKVEGDSIEGDISFNNNKFEHCDVGISLPRDSKLAISCEGNTMPNCKNLIELRPG